MACIRNSPYCRRSASAKTDATVASVPAGTAAVSVAPNAGRECAAVGVGGCASRDGELFDELSAPVGV